MKTKFLTILAAMMLSVNLYSQSFVINEYDKIDGYEIGHTSSTMEGDDGSIFVAVNLSGMTRIMEMTELGEIIESKYLELKGYGHRGFHPFLRHPDKENTNVYVYVTHKEGSVPTYNAVFFDNNLNKIEEVSTPLYSSKHVIYSDYESYLLDSENNIVVRVGDGSDNKFLFVKMDIDGKILNEKEVVIETGDPIIDIPYHSLCVYNKEPLQYGFVFTTHTNGVGMPKSTVVVLDSDFNVVEKKEDLITNIEDLRRSNIEALDDDSYLVTTGTFHANPNIAYGIMISKFDKEHNLINSFEYKQNTVNYHNYTPELVYKNIITTEEGLYWIYTMEGEDSKGLGNLYVSFFDKDLNLQWRQKIHETLDHDYVHIFSATLRDNGDLLISMIDCTNFTEQNDLYYSLLTTIIKNEGDILDITENTTSIKPYYVYPNPAEDVISLNCSSEVACERVEIYSLDGRLCHSQNFNLKTINIEELSSGVYMMKVVLDNGNSYTEKIVKR